jgi:hypothetical protein
VVRSGWVYTAADWPLDCEQSHEEWLEGVRAQGWKLWQPDDTWEGVQVSRPNGRQVIRHCLRRWAGPGPEPSPSWDTTQADPGKPSKTAPEPVRDG